MKRQEVRKQIAEENLKASLKSVGDFREWTRSLEPQVKPYWLTPSVKALCESCYKLGDTK